MLTLQNWLEANKALSFSFQSQIDIDLTVCSIVTGRTVEYLEELPYLDFSRIVKNVSSVLIAPNTRPQQIGKYEVIPNTSLTFGGFISVNHYLTDINTFPHAIACFCRLSKPSDFGKDIEPLTYDVNTRANELMNESHAIAGVVESYLEWFKSIQKSLTNIFPPELDEVDEQEPVTNSGNWSDWLFSLVDNDIKKAYELLDLPALFVLNMANKIKS